jgi:hypothetical protein
MDPHSPLHDVFIEAHELAGDVRHVCDVLIAKGVDVPDPIRQLIRTLPDRAVHLRDAIHDAGLDPDDELATPRNIRND